MRIAALPWYALTEVRPALDALWGEVAGRLSALEVADVPDDLDHDGHYEDHWQSGRLLLGQACGYDAVFGYSQRLRVVATPQFEFPGCVGANYRSFVVVREDTEATELEQLRGLRCVINTPASHSGMNILRSLIAPLHERGRFFGQVTVSGAHEHSMRALQRDEADVASIDCITYGLLKRHRPHALDGTRVLMQTEALPAPPFVTSADTPDREVEALRQALTEVLQHGDFDGSTSVLGLRGVERLEDSAYQSVADLAESARRQGYFDELGQASEGTRC